MAHHWYSGHVAVLATKHAKDEAIGSVFHDLLGIQVQVVNIDTDSFGTFAGDIPRTDSPLNTAVAKARAGMAESGNALGLASEGTIGPDPFMPFITADIETIVFVDDERGIIVSETTRSTEIVAIRETVVADEDLTEAPRKSRLPPPRFDRSTAQATRRTDLEGHYQRNHAAPCYPRVRFPLSEPPWWKVTYAHASPLAVCETSRSAPHVLRSA